MQRRAVHGSMPRRLAQLVLILAATVPGVHGGSTVRTVGASATASGPASRGWPARSRSGCLQGRGLPCTLRGGEGTGTSDTTTEPPPAPDGNRTRPKFRIFGDEYEALTPGEFLVDLARAGGDPSFENPEQRGYELAGVYSWQEARQALRGTQVWQDLKGWRRDTAGGADSVTCDPGASGGGGSAESEDASAGGGDAEQGAARASAGTGQRPLQGLRGGIDETSMIQAAQERSMTPHKQGTGQPPLQGLRGGMDLDALAGLGEGDGGGDEWMATLQKSRPDLFTSNAQVQHVSML